MKTILIVDDEPAARYGLRRALEAKYRIAEADSAEAATEALAQERPDLVLLDVVLPGQDGLSFLRWMREQGSEIPVLMVSALDTAKTAVEALQLGAAVDDRRAVWADDRALRGNAALFRNGGPRGADGFHDIDPWRERNRKGFAGAGDSCAFAASGKGVRGRELRGAAGDADRIGTIWLRAWGVYGRGAAEKGKV